MHHLKCSLVSGSPWRALNTWSNDIKHKAAMSKAGEGAVRLYMFSMFIDAIYGLQCFTNCRRSYYKICLCLNFDRLSSRTQHEQQ